MSDMNSFNGIVRVLEVPKKKIIKNNLSVTKFRVQFPQGKNSYIMQLIIWGNLANFVTSYYKVNDHVVIEGYVRIKKSLTLKSRTSISKNIEIIVFKIYPLLLDSKRPLATFF